MGFDMVSAFSLCACRRLLAAVRAGRDAEYSQQMIDQRRVNISAPATMPASTASVMDLLHGLCCRRTMAAVPTSILGSFTWSVGANCRFNGARPNIRRLQGVEKIPSRPGANHDSASPDARANAEHQCRRRTPNGPVAGARNKTRRHLSPHPTCASCGRAPSSGACAPYAARTSLKVRDPSASPPPGARAQTRACTRRKVTPSITRKLGPRPCVEWRRRR